MIDYGGESARKSASSSVAGLFMEHARRAPEAVALDDGNIQWTYGQLASRSAQLAGALIEHGVHQGDRVAILSENRLEYLELFIATARIGAILACQNWRLAAPEIRHCMKLVEPVLTLVSPRHLEALRFAGLDAGAIVFGDEYENLLKSAIPLNSVTELDSECPYLILYTSGTTGLPKGAVISHRAEIARNMSLRAEFGLQPNDTFVAWSPLYHMGAAELSLGTLMAGGKVIVVDGFNQLHLTKIITDEKLGWLLLMPGMVGDFANFLETNSVIVMGIKVCGVMADLVPPVDIARITTLLSAPYANTFGATETGCPPCSSDLIPIGVTPDNLSKSQSPFCEVRLVDADDNEVPDGQPGELCMRGPTNFSGYWRSSKANYHDFRGGWFHMGDVFVRNPDGSLDFVDRVKYLIKSGGENIYPAEIERVMLEDPRVSDVAVVRRADHKWGEVPVAFVARRDNSLTMGDLLKRCRANLAGFKQPKDIFYIDIGDFPRSASGKIQRHELEKKFT